uniref:Uncharacterized protein n=1 Tax=Timema poppense TaxID=170557 RepID=A0A7R9DPR1_TIMPO|nr:unnamed protein product [Timema poppensis]
MWVIRPRRSQADLLVVCFITSNMAGSLEQNNDSSKYIWSSSGSLSLGAVISHSELVTRQTELVTSQTELVTSQTELVASQRELVTSQTELVTSQTELVTSQTELVASQTELGMNHTNPGYEIYTASEPNLTDLNHSSRSRENGKRPVLITDYMAVPRLLDIIAYIFYDPETTTLRLENPYSNYSEVSNVSQFPASFHSRNSTRHAELEGPENAYSGGSEILDNELRRLNATISHDTFPATEVLTTSMKTTVTKLDKPSMAGSVSSSGTYYLGSEDTYLPGGVTLDHSSPKDDRGNEMQVFDKLLLLDLPSRTVRHPPFRYKRQTNKVPEGLSDDSSAPSALSDRSLLTHEDKVPGGLSDDSSAPSALFDRSLLTPTDGNHLKADPLSSRERRLGMIVKKSSEKIQGFSVQSSDSVSKSNHSREHLSAVSAELTQIIHSREHSSSDAVDSNQRTVPLNTASGPIIGQHQMNYTSSLIQEDMNTFPYATMMSSVAYATPRGTSSNHREPPGSDEQYLDVGGPPVVIIQYFNPLFVDYDLHSSSYPHVHAHNTKVVEVGQSFRPLQSRSHKQRTHPAFSSEQQNPVRPKKAE